MSREFVPYEKRIPADYLIYRAECAMAVDRMVGICLECEDEAYGVEPDARCYTCESCGAKAVFGAEEIVMMGVL